MPEKRGSTFTAESIAERLDGLCPKRSVHWPLS